MFRATREKRLGTTLEEGAQKRETCLPMVQKAMQAFDHTLGELPYLDGDRPGYADIHLLGLLIWVRVMSDLPITARCQNLAPWVARCRHVFASLPDQFSV